MNLGSYTKPFLALAACWAVYKYAPNNVLKGAALAIGAQVAAKNLPVVKDYV